MVDTLAHLTCAVPEALIKKPARSAPAVAVLERTGADSSQLAGDRVRVRYRHRGAMRPSQLASLRAERDVAFEPRSRRPQTSPQATDPALIQPILRLRTKLVDAGLDAGADTIGCHLQHTHRRTVARATINRILVRAGAVTATTVQASPVLLRSLPGRAAERLLAIGLHRLPAGHRSRHRDLVLVLMTTSGSPYL